MITAIFPTAGQSRRMKSAVNKNFLELDGIPILIRTLQTFSQSSVDNFIIVTAKAEIEFVKEMLSKYELKPYKVVIGGSERQYSIANALKIVDDDCKIILVHDSARPLIKVETIEAVIKSAQEYGGAIAAVPVKDTIKVVNVEGFVIDTPPRKDLISVQTPQGFKREILLKAYEQALKDNFLGTDDSSLVERLGYKVKLVQSDYANIKITTPEDILTAKILLERCK